MFPSGRGHEFTDKLIKLIMQGKRLHLEVYISYSLKVLPLMIIKTPIGF